jgi:hypothetical protein
MTVTNARDRIMTTAFFTIDDVSTLKALGYTVTGATYNTLDKNDVKIHSMILSWKESDISPFYVKVKKTKSGYSFTKDTLLKIDGKIAFGVSNKISGNVETISRFLKKVS